MRRKKKRVARSSLEWTPTLTTGAASKGEDGDFHSMHGARAGGSVDDIAIADERRDAALERGFGSYDDVAETNGAEEGGKEEEEESNKASIFQTTVNITNNVIGAGLLSLPWCIKESSVVYGTIMVILFGLLQAVTFVLIVACCDYAGTYSFMELGRRLLGSAAGSAIQLCMLIYTAGSCLSFVVLTGDFISSESGFARELCGDSCIFSSRAFSVFVVTVVLYAPLCALQDLRSLWFTSLLSVCSMFYLLALTIWEFSASHGINPCTDEPPVIDTASAGTGLFSAAPIVGVAYIAHYNAPRFYSELKDRSIPRFARCVLMSFGCCTVVYCAFGILGYLTFGHQTKPDLLENFAANSEAAIIARVALFLLVSSTYPLAFHSLRASAVQLYFTSFSSRDSTKMKFWLLTGPLMAITICPGMVLENVGVVLDYKGSLVGSSIAFIIPGVMALIIVKRRITAAMSDSPLLSSFAAPSIDDGDERGESHASTDYVFKCFRRRGSLLRTFGIFCVVFGCIVALTGTIVTTLKLVGVIHSDEPVCHRVD